MKPGRLRTTLVYFGLLEDEAEARRIDEAPLTGWRVAAAALFGAVVVGLAVVVLDAVTGWDVDALALALAAGAVAAVGGVGEWRSARRARGTDPDPEPGPTPGDP